MLKRELTLSQSLGTEIDGAGERGQQSSWARSVRVKLSLIICYSCDSIAAVSLSSLLLDEICSRKQHREVREVNRYTLLMIDEG